jgi:hypothetical protein
MTAVSCAFQDMETSEPRPAGLFLFVTSSIVECIFNVSEPDTSVVCEKLTLSRTDVKRVMSRYVLLAPSFRRPEKCTTVLGFTFEVSASDGKV